MPAWKRKISGAGPAAQAPAQAARVVAQALQAPAYLPAATAFAPLSFALGPGQALCLRGPSGSGKSTVLASLALLQPACAQRLELLGRPASHYSPSQAAQLRQTHLGILHQGNNLLAQLSVAANVTLQARLAGRLPCAERLAAALAALQLVPLASRLAGQLSGGEAARVGLARLVYQAPALVLADEPSAGQDPARAQAVSAVLCALRDAGSAVVVATHDAALADALGPSLWLREAQR